MLNKRKRYLRIPYMKNHIFSFYFLSVWCVWVLDRWLVFGNTDPCSNTKRASRNKHVCFLVQLLVYLLLITINPSLICLVSEIQQDKNSTTRQKRPKTMMFILFCFGSMMGSFMKNRTIYTKHDIEELLRKKTVTKETTLKRFLLSISQHHPLLLLVTRNNM